MSPGKVRQVLDELSVRVFARIEGGEWKSILTENIFLGREGYVQAFRARWSQYGQQRRGEGYREGAQSGAVFCITRAQYDDLKARITSEFWRFFSSLPTETQGDVVVYNAIDLFEA